MASVTEDLRRRSAATSVAALGLAGGATVVIASGFVLGIRSGQIVLDPAVAVPFVLVGAVLTWRRPAHRVGWLMAGIGAAVAVLFFTTQYSHFQRSNGSYLPGAGWAAWARGPTVDAVYLVLTLFLLLFPTGRPRSPGGRRLGVAVVINAVVGMAIMALWPQVNAQASGHAPFQLLPLGGLDVADAAYLLHGIVQQLLFVLIAGGTVVRFRRSSGVERLQLKWFAYAVSLFVLTTVAGVAGWGTVRVGVATLPLVAGATAVAVLRYRLYDIDVVLSKTVVVVVLGAFVTVVYAAVVTVLGEQIGGGFSRGRVPSLIATAIVAVGFQPVRLWAERLGGRLVYGRRASPYEVLAALPLRVLEAGSDALGEVARACADGVRCTKAEVWASRGGDLTLVATWPTAQEAVVAETVSSTAQLGRDGHLAMIRDLDVVVGALRVFRAADDPIKPADAALLDDVAREAALVLRNLHLAEELEQRLDQLVAQAAELRSSRARIVAAQDAERRRIERNLHDGAQQRLVTLALRLRTAEAGTARADNLRAEMDRAVAELGLALGELRETARGIHPALLSEDGLTGAIEALAERSSVPVSVHVVPQRRFSAEVEYASYYVIAEALTNTAKHAAAGQARVSVDHDGTQLRIEVRDNGCGGAALDLGTGLRGLSDRVAALDGRLIVQSAPATGTSVVALIPCT